MRREREQAAGPQRALAGPSALILCETRALGEFRANKLRDLTPVRLSAVGLRPFKGKK